MNNNKKMAERKQVNLNLGKVSATPSMQAVGGTNQVAVQSVLKDNAAMRLSRSLSQFSNILGQTSNINMQLGKEAAEKLSSQEINDIIEGKVPAPDGGALGKLGFQKAFHQVSAKRYADTTAIQEYTDVENRVNLKLEEFVQSGTPIEVAMAYVEDELKTVQEKIGKNFENNVYGQRVINMITGELSSRVRVGASKGYVEKQKAYLDNVEIEKASNDVLKVFTGEVGPVAYLQSVDKRLKNRSIPPLKRNTVMRSIVIGATETLIDRGQFSDAAHYLKQWQKTKVGGKPINETLEMAKTTAALFSKIAAAKKKSEGESDDGISFPQQQNAYKGAVINLLNAATQYNNYSPRNDEEGDQSEKMINKVDIQVNQVLDRLQTNYPEEILNNWKKQFRDTIISEKTKGKPLRDTIRSALNNLAIGRDLNDKKLDDIQISEKAKNIAVGTVTEIDRALDASTTRTQIQMNGGYNNNQKKELEDKAREEFEKNENMDPFDFIREFADATQLPWKGLKNVHIDVHKIDWINEETSPYVTREDAVRAGIGLNINAGDFKTRRGKEILDLDNEIKSKVLEVNEMITKEMREEARVISEKKIPLVDKEAELKVIRDEIIRTENEELGFELKAKKAMLQSKAIEKNSYDVLHADYYNNGKGKSNKWKNAVDNNKKSTQFPTLSNTEFLENAIEYKEAIENKSPNAASIDIPWDKVNTDLEEARNINDKVSTVRAILLFYGYPEFSEDNVVKDLQSTKLSFDQVRLVRTHEQLEDLSARFIEATKYYNPDNEYIGADILRKNKGMTSEEQTKRKQIIKDLEIMTNLGIWEEEGVMDFINMQINLLPARQ